LIDAGPPKRLAKRENDGAEINIFERRRLFKGGRLETDRGAKPEVSHRGLHAGQENAREKRAGRQARPINQNLWNDFRQTGVSPSTVINTHKRRCSEIVHSRSSAGPK